MAKQKKDFTEDWLLYEKGKDYNYSIDLYSTVNRNERFYRGDQWNGVEAGNLPTPVFNIFKRIINYYISTIMSSKTSMRFSYASPYGADGYITKEEVIKITDTVNKVLEDKAQHLRLDGLLSDALEDAAISGDAVAYTYFDPYVKTGQKFSGDFKTVLVDNTNVFFGNPNISSVEGQPYILISTRETVSSLREAARRNGASEEEISKITADSETSTQSGSLSAKEPEGTKCTAVIKLWIDEKGYVRYRKSVKNAVIAPETETKLRRYPVCFMNWTRTKGSWHGQAVATGLIENQIFINKSFAMVMKHMMDTAFSKVVYDSTVIDGWTNLVGEAVAVNGNVDGVAKVLSSGQMQSGMLDVINMAIEHTKEFIGATDTALGDVAPTNTSAILALQQASNMPLENIKRQLYRFVEELGLIWLDFVFAYYDDKRLVYEENDAYHAFPVSQFRTALFDCRVDVGASSYYSEIASLNTLDSLLQLGHISLKQYLERIPDNLIPKKTELLEEVTKAAEAASRAQHPDGTQALLGTMPSTVHEEEKE